jgi:tetratricopeptide (TPR) repeat protein
VWFDTKTLASPIAMGPNPMATPNELYDAAAELKDKGDKPGAIAKLEEALVLDPGFALAHGMLAKLYVDLAEIDKAIFHAKKVVELEPDDTFSYTALSVIYQRCGKIPEAEHAKALAFNKQMGFE